MAERISRRESTWGWCPGIELEEKVGNAQEKVRNIGFWGKKKITPGHEDWRGSLDN